MVKILELEEATRYPDTTYYDDAHIGILLGSRGFQQGEKVGSEEEMSEVTEFR